MGAAGVVIAVLLFFIVWTVGWTVLAVILHNKTFEKWGLIGWLGHGAHLIVNGATFADLRLHHFTKKVSENNSTGTSQPTNDTITDGKQAGGMYRGGIYDPDF